MFNNVEGWLRTEGTIFVNEKGEEVLLRGHGVGNWLNPEGFLFGGSEFSASMPNGFARATDFGRGRNMDLFITELCGREYQQSFWKKWVENYFNENDIVAMKEEGFNSVRLPLDARLLLKEEPGYIFDEEQFKLLERLIDKCEEVGLYVILDMHAACAGQSAIGCDNGVDNMPHLFTDEEGEERTIRLWEELAKRFKDRWIVAGYELLNEPIALPMWDYLIPELRSFYEKLVSAIRAIDTRHILFIQGHRFSSRTDVFDRDFDPKYHNWAMATHLYETFPDLAMLGPVLEKRDELNVPVWMGETGGSEPSEPEVGNAWMAATYELFMENHISYNIWCAKAVENADAAFGHCFKRPEGWQQIVDYCGKGGAKPSYEKAIRTFDELLENIKLENCTAHPENIDALMRRPGTLVFASSYDSDSEHRGSYKYALYCGFRREDRMHLMYEPGYVHNDLGGLAMLSGRHEKYGDWRHIWLRLEASDVASYSVRQAENEVKVRLQCMADEENVVRVSCGDKVLFEGTIPVSDKLAFVDVGMAPSGDRSVVKLECIKGSLIMRAIQFCK